MGFPPKGWRERYFRQRDCQLRCSVKLPDGGVLAYDNNRSTDPQRNPDGDGAFRADRFFPGLSPSENPAWRDASHLDPANPPSRLEAPSGPANEIGPPMLLRNGNR